jgi:hypothetical protein
MSYWVTIWWFRRPVRTLTFWLARKAVHVSKDVGIRGSQGTASLRSTISAEEVWWCGVPYPTPEKLNWSTSPATTETVSDCLCRYSSETWDIWCCFSCCHGPVSQVKYPDVAILRCWCIRVVLQNGCSDLNVIKMATFITLTSIAFRYRHFKFNICCAHH